MKKKEISYIIRYVRLSAYKRCKKNPVGRKKVVWGDSEVWSVLGELVPIKCPVQRRR